MSWNISAQLTEASNEVYTHLIGGADMREYKYGKRMTHNEIQKQYDAENTVQIHLKLNSRTDADIIQKLSQVNAKQTYIKKLIRQDIGR